MRLNRVILLALFVGFLPGSDSFAYEVGDLEVLNKVRKLDDVNFNGLAQLEAFRAKFNNFKIKITVIPELMPNQLSRMVPKFTNSGIQVELLVHESALKNPVVISEVIEEIKGLSRVHQKMDLLRWMEFAASSDSKGMNAGMLLYEESACYYAHDFFSDRDQIFRLLDSPSADAKAEYLKARIDDFTKRRALPAQPQNKVSTLVDDESFAIDLAEKATRNDREGVARLLDQSLPWDEMSSSETTAYRKLIDGIRNPSGKKVVLYRGTGGTRSSLGNEPFVRSASLHGDGLRKNLQAFRSEGSKNKGFYLPNFKSKQWEWIKSVGSLSEGMRQHGHYSSYTPYISTSSSVGQAISFGSASGKRTNKLGLLILEVDESRVIPNIASQFSEFEYLLPLLIFPDEIKARLYGDPIQVYSKVDQLKSATHATQLAVTEESFQNDGIRFFQKASNFCPRLLKESK